MAVTVDDLTSPAGDLEPAVLWPGEASADVTARLAGYLTDAEARAAVITDADDKDRAIVAYAYHRAYQSVATRLAATPSSVTLNDQGSVTTTAAQLAAMQELADRWRDKFDALLPVPEDAALNQPSAAVPTVIRW